MIEILELQVNTECFGFIFTCRVCKVLTYDMIQWSVSLAVRGEPTFFIMCALTACLNN